MAFNPLQEKGMPIEKQFRNWKELNTKPYDKMSVHPYTRTAGILMNGIEVEAALFSQMFACHSADMDVRRTLALIRRIEQEQQKAVNWMIPADESVLEVTIGYEQVAVDLTAFLAQHEKDRYVKQALDFALLEDFDHLYRYANLLRMLENKDASDITKQYTEITIGRPTALEHRYPYDDVRKFGNRKKADPMTLVHINTIVAAEQQTMNYYMNLGNRFKDEIARGLYLEIGQIEEQHVTHYRSLMDPKASWFERELFHELTECWLYHSLIHYEENRQARSVWERHLEMEIEHLRMAAEMFKEHEKRDPEEVLSESFEHNFQFKSNVEYVRSILGQQIGYNAMGTEFVPSEKMPKDYRYFAYQKLANGKDVPSETIIKEIIGRDGGDYRQELAGPHPVEEYRQEVLVAHH